MFDREHVPRRTLIAAALLAVAAPVMGQETYPGRRPIRIIVPFAAGSGTDSAARQITQALSARHGWQFVIDNKAGANGFLAAQDLIAAAPDGHTLLFSGNTTHAANPALFKSLPYDPVADFAPITRILTGPLVLFAAPKHGFKTVEDLVAAARKNPGKLSFATGSASHRLAAEIFRDRAKIEIVHVPYKGSAQALTDIVGGHVDFMFVDSAAGMGFLKGGGTLDPLAVTSLTRVAAFKDVPTMSEAGYPGFQVTAWTALFAPKATPAPLIATLHKAVADYLGSPEGKAYVDGVGGLYEPTTPQELAAFVRSETDLHVKTFRAAGIEAQ